MEDHQNLFNRSISAEIWRLSVHREHSAIFEGGPDGGWNERLPLFLNNLITATAVPAERNLPLLEGRDALENYVASIAPRLSICAEENFEDQMPSFQDIEYHWMHFTERALLEMSIERLIFSSLEVWPTCWRSPISSGTPGACPCAASAADSMRLEGAMTAIAADLDDRWTDLMLDAASIRAPFGRGDWR